MSKRKLEINTNLCKGCGFCVKECPKGALALTDAFNPAGYHYVVLNEETCIGCGTCYTVCPDYVYVMLEE